MNGSKKFVVITSIFAPTESVIKFAAIEGWQLIVVGDKKTPANWHQDGVIYLGPEDQVNLGYKIIDLLPWNHYCRKMVGYLYAMEHGAELIADTDDDNIPYENWPFIPDESTKHKTISNAKFVNIYKYFTDQFIWPRGYPLNRILEKESPVETVENINVGVWQFLADEDPDVDAIYRLTSNKLVTFDKSEPIALNKGTVSPFNSQNTIFNKELFVLLYLPSFVTFRFTDILRGLIAQPIMWEQELHLGIGAATVIQKRNPHDYLRDFESEIPVYIHSERVIDLITAVAKNSGAKPAELLVSAYTKLCEEKIVTNDEVELIHAWAKDVSRIIG
ncbi:MAG: hypothetical protein JWO47_956 [Candidatus Saccharibacteria bacterium]|nr:hypothetical protein [Candidatus Saccharibacteria bacterium]